jgi:hypothetical protein
MPARTWTTTKTRSDNLPRNSAAAHHSLLFLRTLYSWSLAAWASEWPLEYRAGFPLLGFGVL